MWPPPDPPELRPPPEWPELPREQPPPPREPPPEEPPPPPFPAECCASARDEISRIVAQSRPESPLPHLLATNSRGRESAEASGPCDPHPAYARDVSTCQAIG